jgi:hypothetical protein
MRSGHEEIGASAMLDSALQDAPIPFLGSDVLSAAELAGQGRA